MIKYSLKNYSDLNKEIEELVYLQKDLTEMKNTIEKKNKQLYHNDEAIQATKIEYQKILVENRKQKEQAIKNKSDTDNNAMEKTKNIEKKRQKRKLQMKNINKKLQKKHHLKVKRQVREEMKANIILTASVWMLTIMAIIMNGNILMRKKTINDKKIIKNLKLNELFIKVKRKKKQSVNVYDYIKKTVISLLIYTLL